MSHGSVGARLARYYDLDLLEDPGDVEMYLALAAETSGRILELCAGSGRISVPLAAAGHHVTAVDRDRDMLDRARSAWKGRQTKKGGGGRLTLKENDVTLLELGERFDLVIFGLNSLLTLDGAAAQQAAIAAIERHLAPSGRAVIDVWLPAPGDLELYDGRLVLDWVRRDTRRGEMVAKLTAAQHDPELSTAEVTTLFDAWVDGRVPRRVMRQDTVHFLDAKELIRLAEKAGMAVERAAGGYSLEQFDARSDRIVLICRPAARRKSRTKGLPST